MSSPKNTLAKSTPAKANGLTALKPLLPISVVRRRLRWLQIVVPLGLMLLVIVYELGPSHWIEDGLGVSHFVAEILLYGTVGPLLAYLVLAFIGRWLEERETTEVQAQVLAQAHRRVQTSRQLSDDALQTLFAASTLLASLKSAAPDLSPDTAALIDQTERALDQAIRQLREHLLN